MRMMLLENLLFSNWENILEKISACVVAQDESFMLELSIRSVSKIVDEVIILENDSCDDTKLVIENLKSQDLGVNLVVLEDLGFNSLADMRNLVESKVTSDWLVWWDADFVPSETNFGKSKSLTELFDGIRNSSENINQVLISGVNVGPVIGYDLTGRPLHGSTGDTQIVRKNFMRFEVKDYVDSRVYNSNRRCKYLSYNGDSYFYHVDIKNPMRLVVRPYIHEYRRRKALGLYLGDFGEYLKEKLGTTDRFFLVDSFLKKTTDLINPFNSVDFGALPEKLVDMQKFEPFCLKNKELSLTDIGEQNVQDYKWDALLAS